ncbi:hypothetical protein J2X45_002649 [Caulobacter sp. BE264]|uniref:hypothetical protein n=1 Tax=Caulobacter sp. BE264 TaxID=2817724 RepID=UPI0028668245|nr:hypothetical protein [Caulobacter sp. BE264]MDR7231549.1 hypothetical protein [Caulobacter sp. BE264]
MKRLTALLALGLSACVAAPVADAGPARCDVTIRFGSYGAGIDRALADQVAAAVKSDRAIARSERKPWGREGEFDQCLTVKPGRDARAVFARYRAMLPARNLKAPTSIEGPDGLKFETIAPM